MVTNDRLWVFDEVQLMGVDLDVSRFIRDGDERDVQVFWRAFDPDPDDDEPRPRRDELCSVPFLDLRRWMEGGLGAWRWDVLAGAWVLARRDAIVPGAVLMLRAAEGGYTAERGWSPKSAVPVVVVSPAVAVEDAAEEAIDADPLSELGAWVPLTTHSLDARDATVEIIAALAMVSSGRDRRPAHAVKPATGARGSGDGRRSGSEMRLLPLSGRLRIEAVRAVQAAASAISLLPWARDTDTGFEPSEFPGPVRERA